MPSLWRHAKATVCFAQGCGLHAGLVLVLAKMHGLYCPSAWVFSSLFSYLLMQISYAQKDHVCVVALRGNLALDKVLEARKALKPVLEGSKADSALLVDMRKVNFIDSSGIGLVVSLFKVMQERKGQFGLSGLSGKNKEIFSITRLDRIMDLYANEAAALKGLKAPKKAKP